MKKQLAIASNKPDQAESYEVMIADLTNQLKDMQSKLKEQDSKAKQQITIEELKQQIEGIKTQHAYSMERGLMLSSSHSFNMTLDSRVQYSKQPISNVVCSFLPSLVIHVLQSN